MGGRGLDPRPLKSQVVIDEYVSLDKQLSYNPVELLVFKTHD